MVKSLGNIYGHKKGGNFAGIVYDKAGLSPTLNTMQGGNTQPMIIDDTPLRAGRQGLKVCKTARIRKLTPKECWRLMGFTDEDFQKAEEVNSNSQLYKQAGNSVCVPVLEAIFKQMI